jgi:hypothetical protein
MAMAMASEEENHMEKQKTVSGERSDRGEREKERRERATDRAGGMWHGPLGGRYGYGIGGAPGLILMRAI